MKDKLAGLQDKLNEITEDLPKLPEKEVTQQDLDEILAKLKALKNDLEKFKKELDALDKEQRDLEEEAAAFAR